MYRGVRHLMNNMRMRNKLLFSYVLIVIIPVLVVGGCVTFYLREQALDSAIAQTVNNVEKIKSQTANLMSMHSSIERLRPFVFIRIIQRLSIIWNLSL